MLKPSRVAPWMFLLSWTALIFATDAILLQTAWRQHHSASYATTKGRIVQSTLGQSAIGRRGLVIRYTYVVDGAAYQGVRYRYDDHSATLRYAATVKEFPPRSVCTVYYNPADPHDALLAPGTDGCDLLLLLMAAPFTAGIIMIWAIALGQRSAAVSGREAGGVKIIRRGSQTRVRLTQTPALMAAGGGLAAAAVGCASFIVVRYTFDPPISAIQAAWAVTLAAGIAVGAWRALRNRSGRCDLVIEEAAPSVTLPLAAGRAGALTIPRAQLQAVIIQRRTTTTRSGDHYSYFPALRRAAPSDETIALLDWGWTEWKAEAFAQWLGEQLKVEFKGVEDVPNSQRAMGAGAAPRPQAVPAS